NTTRQVGSVLGSAAISALLSARMSAQGLGEAPAGEGGAGMGHIPAQVLDKLSTALAQSTLLPAGVLLIGAVASALFIGSRAAKPSDASGERVPVDVGH
ncbi:MFS transporter, partial [Nocardia gipuzkoensis]